MKNNRIPCMLAALLLAGAVISCGDSDGGSTSDKQNGTDAVTAAPDVTQETDPFSSFDYGGEEVRIFVSSCINDMAASSVYTIRPEEGVEAGDVVNDAVIARNLAVEELLNVKLVFAETEDDYAKISATLKNLLLAGDDAYDLFINALYPLASLSMEGYFLNACENPYLDFSQSYWYDDYMSDLCFDNENIHYLLAGDYFLDVLRSAHALYVNKTMFNTLYESTDELYQLVFDGKWTQEAFLGYMTEVYSDVNGDGKRDVDDRYGYCTIGYWGPMIPWVVSADITYLEYESDGAPYFAMNNERSVKLLETLNLIFHSDATKNYTAGADACTAAFINGNALFSGYQRVSSLEMFRDMETDIGILPYPKMDEAQEHYITSSHDTANVGAIPMTTQKFDMLGPVLEVLSRETAKSVMPAYYETALKVKYVRDDASAQILDIIRYNISDVFPIAFGNYCSDLPLGKAFSTPLGGKKTDFVSNYEKHVDGAQKKLDELWEAFSEHRS